MTTDLDLFGSLMTRLNEARILASEIHHRFGPEVDVPSDTPQEVGRLGMDVLRFVAPVELPVLLWGDAGPAAGRIARLIHDHSPWNAGTFIELHGASLKQKDIHARLDELAPAGAQSRHVGTIYLDEITSLDPEVQDELIGRLEADPDHACRGRLPMRLISSTSRSIEGAIETGALSERLYALAARIVIPIPSKPDRFVSAARRSFTTRMVAEVKRLQGSRDGELYPYFLRLLQRSLARLVLEKTRGNQIRAARVLGVNRNTLRKWMRLLEGAA